MSCGSARSGCTGRPSRGRFELADQHHPRDPHEYLFFIGMRPHAQGPRHNQPGSDRARVHRAGAGAALVGDITYLRTGEGWLYLATVIDLATRMVVGWQLAEHMRTSLVTDALTMAITGGHAPTGVIFHSVGAADDG
jgi:transposase InsO family protein